MKRYQQLCSDIEKALHKQIKTPKDFNFLSQNIYARLHVLISQSTLMRLWGYINEEVTPRESTLDALAQYLGYRHWQDYQHNGQQGSQPSSAPVLSRRLSVKDQLAVGQQIRLTWLPDRMCHIEYLGDLKFRIVSSENTRLNGGDTFECHLFVEGEPLYLDNLHHENMPPCAYVCGEIAGIHFEIEKMRE